MGMFQKAIADSLGISPNDVVKLVVVAIQQGSDSGRRLRGSEAKKYLVSYEILPPSSLDPDEVVSRANRIAEANSTESQVFKQVLSTEYGAQAREIVSKQPVRKFEDEVVIADPEAPLANQDETSGVSVTIVRRPSASFAHSFPRLLSFRRLCCALCWWWLVLSRD